MKIREFMPSDSVVARIRADVEGYESERVRAYDMVKWRVPLFLGGLAAAVAFLATAFNGAADSSERWMTSAHVVLYVGAVFGAFFVYRLAMSPATALRQSLRSKILPLVFGFVENVRYGHAFTPDSFGRLPADVTGAFNRQSFDDLVAGRYEGFPFELYEAHLRHKSGKSESTVFKGVVVAFETMAPFPGLLVAVRKAGAFTQFFRGLFGTKLKELKSGVEAIDEAYEFHTDNAGAALPLVTGRLAQALQWLGESWPEQPARVALAGSDGFLLLPLKRNFFEIPGISVSLDYSRHFQPMVADLAALLATAALVRKIGEPDAVGEEPAGAA